jgi:hypothetical protein
MSEHNYTKFTKTISRSVRLPRSTNGNPRYELIFTDGTSARTATDSMVAYEITNSEFRDVPVEFEALPNGDIVNATPVKEG